MVNTRNAATTQVPAQGAGPSTLSTGQYSKAAKAPLLTPGEVVAALQVEAAVRWPQAATRRSLEASKSTPPAVPFARNCDEITQTVLDYRKGELRKIFKSGTRCLFADQDNLFDCDSDSPGTICNEVRDRARNARGIPQYLPWSRTGRTRTIPSRTSWKITAYSRSKT
jgi:hypothetical protein